MKRKVFLLFDVPGSSKGAFAVTCFIMLCIFLSTCCFVLQTLPSLENYWLLWYSSELFFVIVFTGEYVIRFWATPLSKKDFVTDTFNMIDLLAILPFYIELLVYLILAGGSGVDLRFLRAIRLVRVFRLFKVGKYSTNMQLIASAMRRSKEALVLMMFFLGLAMVLFGSMMYFVEQGNWNEEKGCYVRPGDSICSPFESIPRSFYWGVTTMTTVGYGDAVPKTSLGKLITGCSMVMGILVLAMPVTMIGNQFVDAHAEISTELMATKLLHESKDEESVVVRLEEVGTEIISLQKEIDNILPNMKHLAAAVMVADGKQKTARDALDKLEPGYDILARSITNALADVRSYAQAAVPPDADGRWPPQKLKPDNLV